MKKIFFAMLVALGLGTSIYAGLNNSALEKKNSFHCENSVRTMDITIEGDSWSLKGKDLKTGKNYDTKKENYIVGVSNVDYIVKHTDNGRSLYMNMITDNYRLKQNIELIRINTKNELSMLEKNNTFTKINCK